MRIGSIVFATALFALAALPVAAQPIGPLGPGHFTPPARPLTPVIKAPPIHLGPLPQLDGCYVEVCHRLGGHGPDGRSQGGQSCEKQFMSYAELTAAGLSRARCVAQ